MKFRFLAAILLVVLFGSGPAAARIRDDVMSGAFRCAAIGDGRQWLDCYYGAAQPLRSQLALPPASQAQIRLTMAPPPGGGGMPFAQARARDAVMAGAFQCTSIEDDRAVLDCYYAAAQPMRAQLGLTPAPQARGSAIASPSGAAGAALLSPPVRSAGEFGVSAPALPAADHIVSRMVSFKFNNYGIFTVTLANGQVWRQIDGDTALAKLKPPAGKYIVTIQHGFFGSYNLTIKGVPGLFRVSRIALAPPD